MDRGRWRRCSSPLRLKPLRSGRHVFQVIGVNAVGIRQDRPARRAFKLVGAR
jgi:hypothetical protein